MIYIVMGVSGVGKTTIGKKLAERLSLPFYDADDFHPQTNKDKMAAGQSLQDEDRWPWLDSIIAQYPKWLSKKGAVLACSALKESYRNRLCVDNRKVKLIHLSADYACIYERLQCRNNHFFNPALLQSQFDILEIPANGLTVDASLGEDTIVNTIMNKLNTPSEFGLIGLGVMGKSLARNFASNGVKLSLFNRHIAGSEENVAIDFIKEYAVLSNAFGFDDIASFVNSLEVPRKIFLMVNAGPVVDTVIRELSPYLSKDDVIMDGGNSHYKDTERREKDLKKSGIHFIGVGVSGGEAGALKGPSIMPGGSDDGYSIVDEYLEKIAAKDKNGLACCAKVGKGGSGHFVKMIHNGIEYAEMQLITEVYDIFRTHMELSHDEIAAIFKEWSNGYLDSYLLGISATILGKKEGDSYVIDFILDKAKQKGTGGWSTTAALELGVPLDTISQSVMARIASSDKENRVRGEDLYTLSRKRITTLSINTIKNAYQAARIINHSIGIEALRVASCEYEWNIQLSEIARIWTNGCIIRSSFMEDLTTILRDTKMHLLLSEDIAAILSPITDDLLLVTSKVIEGRGTVPVFSAAANYFMAFTRKDSAANMIQAQRDFFGAHTYERIDKEGSFHTVWDN